MIISRTPFRISFFGGGTDFPEFYRDHGGACLLATINKYSYITIHETAPFHKYRYHASYAKTELVDDPAAFQHPLIRECLLFLNLGRGIELAHVADLPGRTGLGTSSSFTVGLLNSLHTMNHETPSPGQLAREAIHIERERVGDAGGHQDQYAAAYGGLMRIDFSGSDGARVTPVAVSDTRRRELQDHLLLFYTGLQQSAHALQTEQRRNIGARTAVLLEMKAMVDEAESLLRSTHPLTPFGDLLHESWRRKKSLADGITNDTVDQAYQVARRTGAGGGKLLGAGGRGFLLLFAAADRHPAIRTALKDLQEVDFALSSEGSRIIFQTPD
jgi:D-glycero-alpha-D-manno-heptose-7-phosphate kinase